MLQKLDPVTGEFKGWRPLGIRSKWGGLVWACSNAEGREAFNHHFTHPLALPEDVAAQQARIETAETELTACELEHTAATSAGIASNVSTTATRLASARAAIDEANMDAPVCGVGSAQQCTFQPH
jgi:hypothetical protein